MRSKKKTIIVSLLTSIVVISTISIGIMLRKKDSKIVESKNALIENSETAPQIEISNLHENLRIGRVSEEKWTNGEVEFEAYSDGYKLINNKVYFCHQIDGIRVIYGNSGASKIITEGHKIKIKENGEYEVEAYGTWNCYNEKEEVIDTVKDEVVGTATIEVNCIDKTPPEFVNLNRKNIICTTKQIKSEFVVEDQESGIDEVQFWLKNEDEEEYKFFNCTDALGDAKNGGEQYLIAKERMRDLKTGYYDIKLVVYDTAGNSNQEEIKHILPEVVPTYTKCGNYKLDNWEWTNQSVKLELEYDGRYGYYEEEYDLLYAQISKDGQNWERKNSIIVTENGPIYVRLTDGINVGESEKIPITNIEKIPPTITFEPDGGTGTIKGAENAILNTKIIGKDTGGSGINKIEYAWSKSKTEEPKVWNTLGDSEEVNQTNITEPSIWYLWAKATDNAGNTKTEVSKEFVVNKQEEQTKGIVRYNYSENGGTSVSKEIDNKTVGEKIDLSVTANKKGYEFVGWNTNKDATTGLTSLEMPDNDISLYAIYKRNIKATFIDYKGVKKNIETNIITIYNNQISGEITAPQINEYNGWKSEFWTKSEDAWTEEKDATQGEKITNITDDVTYYARYSKTITVKFDLNGGTSPNKFEDLTIWQKTNSKKISDIDILYSGSEPILGASKENSLPMCWNTKPDGTGIDYDEGKVVDKASEDMTLYIRWVNADSIDVIRPIITINNKDEWTSNNIKVKISVEGVTSENIKTLKIDGKTIQPVDNEYIYEVEKNGTYSVEIESTKGLTIRKEFEINNIDKEKPVININNNKQNIIEITAKDLDSGIKQLEFSYDKNIWKDCLDNNIEKGFIVTKGTYQEGTANISIQFTKQLKDNLYFRTIDNASNISEVKEVKVENSEIKDDGKNDNNDKNNDETNNEINKDNQNNNNNNEQPKDNNSNTINNNQNKNGEIDNTKATGILPKAGGKTGVILMSILFTLILVAIISIKKYKYLKEIK